MDSMAKDVRREELREEGQGNYVTEPLIAGKGSPGPLCPEAENPYDFLFD